MKARHSPTDPKKRAAAAAHRVKALKRWHVRLKRGRKKLIIWSSFWLPYHPPFPYQKGTDRDVVSSVCVDATLECNLLFVVLFVDESHVCDIFPAWPPPPVGSEVLTWSPQLLVKGPRCKSELV